MNITKTGIKKGIAITVESPEKLQAHINRRIINVEMFRLHGSPFQSERSQMQTFHIGGAAFTEYVRDMGGGQGCNRGV